VPVLLPVRRVQNPFEVLMQKRRIKLEKTVIIIIIITAKDNNYANLGTCMYALLAARCRSISRSPPTALAVARKQQMQGNCFTLY
jgi:hypothetical protein